MVHHLVSPRTIEVFVYEGRLACVVCVSVGVYCPEAAAVSSVRIRVDLMMQSLQAPFVFVADRRWQAARLAKATITSS
jgi:hypothetical protein